jgi:Sigma-70, region 4
MSAALQFPLPSWTPRTGSVNISASAAALQPHLNPSLLASAVHHIQLRLPKPELLPDLALAPATEQQLEEEQDSELVNTWAFYRKHTESLLRRYLYASTQVGRSPNLLGESVGRGWVSSRKVRTFEDALIFVLDVERCLKRLDLIDRQIITRRILQEYTHQETANILGLTLRVVTARLPQAIDHLTKTLVENDLLVLPD